jgi:hypothetical protein
MSCDTRHLPTRVCIAVADMTYASHGARSPPSPAARMRAVAVCLASGILDSVVIPCVRDQHCRRASAGSPFGSPLRRDSRWSTAISCPSEEEFDMTDEMQLHLEMYRVQVARSQHYEGLRGGAHQCHSGSQRIRRRVGHLRQGSLKVRRVSRGGGHVARPLRGRGEPRAFDALTASWRSRGSTPYPAGQPGAGRRSRRNARQCHRASDAPGSAVKPCHVGVALIGCALTYSALREHVS